ncbi:HAD family hydrolase [Actinomyces wuliandei]|uniref:HAD family hydrolase n=1 Tax=Actinomyces wuliandei TaxID=2057743 RepID=UPI003C12B5B7
MPAASSATPPAASPAMPSVTRPSDPPLCLGGAEDVPGRGVHRPLDHEEYHTLVQERVRDLDRLHQSGGVSLVPDPRTVVALDVDGTVLDMDGRVSERVMASVARLRSYDVTVVISTGRGVQAAMPVARHMGLVSGWMVCANGALTLRLDPDAPGGYEVVSSWTFDPTAAIHTLLEAVPDGIVAVEDPGAGFKVSRPFPDGELIEDYEVVSVADLCSTPVTRVVLRAPGMPVDRFSALVRGSGLHSVEYAVGWTAWLDVAPQGVTKARALEDLVQRLGTDASHALAVGDGSNDVEMLEWAGAGVVMGSAPQWVRDRGDIVTEPVWRDGCAAALDAMVERVR